MTQPLTRPRPTRAAAAATALAATVALTTQLVPSASGAPARAAACDPFTAAVTDPTVPTSQDVLGLTLGDRDVTTAESDRYLQAVSDASPMVVDGVLGHSYNGRPLRYAVVGKPRWTGNLDKVGRDVNRLRDASTPQRAADRILRRTPAILWVAGNVHGGEESGTDAALQVLYELAARTDCTAETILDHAIVVVLPTQNPDGREADTRRNSYGFDLNRDWFARTQVETDAKLDKLSELPPQLFIDAHEMGSADYFFPPNADPVYHEIGETPLSWIYDVYGTAMQEAFGRFDIPYFNGSAYDLFYAGYGDTVPAAGFNAAGMTFEKNNADPSTERVREQYVAIWATLMAAGGRDQILAEWRAEHLTAARQGRRGNLEPNKLYYEGAAIDNPVPDRKVRHYFLRPQPGKRAVLNRLVTRLQDMDVDVYRLTRPLTVPGFRPYGAPARTVRMPKGTVWVPMGQGQKHWVQTMLNEDTYVPFPYFYDVTAFSGPLLGNLSGGSTGARLSPVARPARVAEPRRTERIPGAAPTVAIWQVSEESTCSVEGAGWLRWWLDRRLGLLYADLTAGDIAAGALAGTEVLVVPQGSAETALDALGAEGQEALTDWVAAGGRLVTLRDASQLAESLGLTTATSQEATSDIPGSLVRVEVDRTSPLAKGVGRTA